MGLIPPTGLMNGIAGTVPMGAMYVHALYDYEADHRTSLSFHQGDIIQVIAQLESGWWDGVLNGVRGWFPSNYCQIIPSPDDLPDVTRDGALDKAEKDPPPQVPTTEGMPDFLLLDYENEISWDTNTSPPIIKGGSLLALVEQLTRHDKLDSNFNNAFLLTYRAFTSGRELFELLVKRFEIQPPEGLTQANYKTWRDQKQKLIRFRVINILKSWFMSYLWMDEENQESKQLIRDIYTFARDIAESTETPSSAPLMAVLNQRLSEKEVRATVNQNTSAPITPNNVQKLKFLDIDVVEFAQQLTIVESQLYDKIRASECLHKVWQENVAEGEPDPAPAIKALVRHSNQIKNWVTEMILAQMDVKKRVVVIKRFVSIANQCRSLNNFSTLISIIFALDTAPIARLKRTWDQVPQHTYTTLESLRRVTASTKGFSEYRVALHAANPPCIPFIGLYLTDLVCIEDGIPGIIKKNNLINFSKYARMAEVIRNIQQYQNGYSLLPVPELQDYILNNMQAAGDIHEMYDKSLHVEPHESEDEKKAVLAESGVL